MSSELSTRERIKEIVVESLHLEDVKPADITDDLPLFDDGLGLDSVDALELMVSLEQEYGFAIDGSEVDESTMATVSDLAAFVDSMRAAVAADGS